MAQQPSGTVTFLFTDIEASTRLLAELGQDRYSQALAEHCRLLRAAFGRHLGYEVDYEGDAFIVAFQSASEALAAAGDAQEALAAHAWPVGHELRVRMGIHTGEPMLAPPKYVGLDVHKAARIMASGYGGQVLVSAATTDLTGTDGLRDLGEHRLKDIDGAGLDLSTRRGALPAAQDDLEHQPAAPGELLPRPGAGAGADRLADRRRCPPRHPHRPRRHGEDSTGDRGRVDARPGPTRPASSGSGSPRSATPRSSPRQSRKPSAPRMGSKSTSASARCCSSSTTWSR